MRPTRIKGLIIMGRYIIPKEEKYFDMEDCDSRGYPIQKVREVEVEVDEKEWRDFIHDRM